MGVLAMKKRVAVLSVGYWFSAYTLGLLLHPYKTMRELVRRRVFLPLALAPMVVGVGAWGVGMVGLRFGGGLLWLVGLQAMPRFVSLLAFLWWWLVVFLAVWQGLLLYLLGRFWVTLRN